ASRPARTDRRPPDVLREHCPTFDTPAAVAPAKTAEETLRHFPCCFLEWQIRRGQGRDFPLRAGAAVMNSYEFAYYGARLQALNETIESWCAHRDCILETTALLQGA